MAKRGDIFYLKNNKNQSINQSHFCRFVDTLNLRHSNVYISVRAFSTLQYVFVSWINLFKTNKQINQEVTKMNILTAFCALNDWIFHWNPKYKLSKFRDAVYCDSYVITFQNGCSCKNIRQRFIS